MDKQKLLQIKIFVLEVAEHYKSLLGFMFCLSISPHIAAWCGAEKLCIPELFLVVFSMALGLMFVFWFFFVVCGNVIHSLGVRWANAEYDSKKNHQ